MQQNNVTVVPPLLTLGTDGVKNVSRHHPGWYKVTILPKLPVVRMGVQKPLYQNN